MKEIGDLAELARATRSEEDVTTQVIDNDVRIRAQEKSLKRIEVLLAQADDIAQIVRIESELSTRQANLDSLKQQQTWLKDQTRSEEHTSELQSLMRISYAVFCLQKKNLIKHHSHPNVLLPPYY